MIDEELEQFRKAAMEEAYNQHFDKQYERVKPLVTNARKLAREMGVKPVEIYAALAILALRGIDWSIPRED